MKNLMKHIGNSVAKVLVIFGIMFMIQDFTGMAYDQVKFIVWPIWLGINLGIEMVNESEEVVFD